MTKFSLTAAILLASLAASPTSANQAVTEPEQSLMIECAGQYECIDSRPLTPAEVRISLEALKLQVARDPNTSTAEARCDVCELSALRRGSDK